MKLKTLYFYTSSVIDWNSLATELYTPNVAYQKLDYIHNNPVQGKWMLADSPIDYKYSSARFYETGDDEFGLVKHIGERL